MFITDEPGGWKRDSISVAVSVLAATAMLGGSLTLAIEASPQDDPPTGARAGYIQNLESPSRQEWQKPDQVVERLKLEGGQRVAEIGSGSGYFVVRFARAVGEAGKVYAVDIDPDMLNYLRWRAEKEELLTSSLSGPLPMTRSSPARRSIWSSSVTRFITLRIATATTRLLPGR